MIFDSINKYMSHWKSVIWDQTRHWTYRVQIVCQTNGWLRICLYMHLFFFPNWGDTSVAYYRFEKTFASMVTSTIMANKAILATLPKLNSSNWFAWKKEAETFLLLAGLDRIIDAEDISTGMKATEWMATKCMRAFLPYYCALIIGIKPSREAWKKFISKYKKDSVTMCMALPTILFAHARPCC